MSNADVSTDDIYKLMSGELSVSDIHARRALRQQRKVDGRRQNEREKELEKYSTAALIKMKRQYRWKNTDYGYSEAEMREFQIEEYAVLKVLSRRPRVLNKIEGKNARRNAATAHHGPKKLGGRKIGGEKIVHHRAK